MRIRAKGDIFPFNHFYLDQPTRLKTGGAGGEALFSPPFLHRLRKFEGTGPFRCLGGWRSGWGPGVAWAGVLC